MLGSFCLILHSHLPYVINHGTWPHGTDWLYEASAGTYIPFLQTFDELIEEGYHPRATIGITPVLAEQLSTTHFQEGFLLHLNQRILSAREDERHFKRLNDHIRQQTANFWIDHFSAIKNRFIYTYEKNLIKQFKRLQDADVFEIITSAATHGYFPLLGSDSNIRAQIAVGIETHQKHFGKKPNGIWLPECAYRPHYVWKNPVIEDAPEVERLGIEEILSEFGIKFFFTDSSLLLKGETSGTHKVEKTEIRNGWDYTSQLQAKQKEEESYFIGGKKNPCNIYFVQSQLGNGNHVAVFTREPQTASQVWSGIMGYPGDPNYLEFHKKNFPGGHRYWRVTDSKLELGKKQLYHPENVQERIENQATHFVSLVNNVLDQYFQTYGKKGVVCAPYDSELFGHWWFEGPKFIKSVFQKLEQTNEIRISTANEELERKISLEVIALPEGSWGENNDHSVWFNLQTKWTWKLIYRAEELFQQVLRESSGNNNEQLRQILEQAARELLILEASDWQFLITQKSAQDYSEKRFIEHFTTIEALVAMAKQIIANGELNHSERSFLVNLQQQDGLFPAINLDWWK